MRSGGDGTQRTGVHLCIPDDACALLKCAASSCFDGTVKDRLASLAAMTPLYYPIYIIHLDSGISKFLISQPLRYLLQIAGDWRTAQHGWLPMESAC